MAPELLQLQQDGANARAMGRGYFDNPFLRSENMPRATGETLDQWSAKHDAWQLGWTAEDAMRPDAAELLIVRLAG
jgi:hypothetical protein